MTEILKNNTSKWFFFTMLYLVVDYGRPQDVLPILNYIRPGMLVIIILTAYLVFKGGIYQTDTKQTRLIWLFIMLLCLYVPFAVNTFWAYITVQTMLLYMPFILSTIICINSVKRLRIILFVCICIMIYIAQYSLWHKGEGSGNYFKDGNDLALYINMWLPFCYFLFFTEKSLLKKIIYVAGLILGITAVVVTFSRGGFVGLLAMVAVLWLVSPRKILTLSIISIIALILFINAGQTYWHRISTTTNTNEGTALYRIFYWQSAWDMFLDNPLGVGGNNFQVRVPEYQGNRFSRGVWGRVSHSLWFTLIPETGIFGVLIYLMLLYYNIKDIFDIKRLYSFFKDSDSRYLYYLSLAMLASLTGFFASATFISVLYYAHYWYMTAIIIATANIAKRSMNVSCQSQLK